MTGTVPSSVRSETAAAMTAEEHSTLEQQPLSRRDHPAWCVVWTVPQICINIYPDAVPPIHAESYHVATDKVPAKDGDMFRSIFSDNLQLIATRGKKARSTLLADRHCGNGCSIKRAPLSVSYYNEISGGHIGSSVVRRRGCADPVLPLWTVRPAAPTWKHFANTDFRLCSYFFRWKLSPFTDTQGRLRLGDEAPY